MDYFKQFEIFVVVVICGSLFVVVVVEGVVFVIIGCCIDVLEECLGVKFLVCIMWCIIFMFEGLVFLEDCQWIFNDLYNVEVSVFVGGVKVSGYLCVIVFVGFGCCYVVFMVLDFIEVYLDVLMMLDLGDWVVDFVNEGFDCVICLGDLFDLSFVLICLWENCCVVVVVLLYFECCGVFMQVEQFLMYNCLVFGVSVNVQCGWVFQ